MTVRRVVKSASDIFHPDACIFLGNSTPALVWEHGFQGDAACEQPSSTCEDGFEIDGIVTAQIPQVNVGNDSPASYLTWWQFSIPISGWWCLKWKASSNNFSTISCGYPSDKSGVLLVLTNLLVKVTETYIRKQNYIIINQAACWSTGSKHKRKSLSVFCSHKSVRMARVHWSVNWIKSILLWTQSRTIKRVMARSDLSQLRFVGPRGLRSTPTTLALPPPFTNRSSIEYHPPFITKSIEESNVWDIDFTDTLPTIC